MAKTILLYTSIYSDSSKKFVEALNEDSSGVTVRINSPGGSVFSTWAMITNLKEYKGTVKIKVDGLAASMAAFFLPYFDNVEASSLSRFNLHRADIFMPTEDEKKELEAINKDLREALEKKIDVAKFTEITGVTLDELFNIEGRKEVYLSAEEAKACGLVSKVNTFDATAEGSEGLYSVAAILGNPQPEAKKKPEEKPNNRAMTFEEFKANHPEIFAQAVKQGETQERDRVGSWMVYVDADAKTVAEGIKEGNPLSATVQAELGRKLLSANALKVEETENADDLSNETPEQKEARIKAEKEAAGEENKEKDYLAAIAKEAGTVSK